LALSIAGVGQNPQLATELAEATNKTYEMPRGPQHGKTREQLAAMRDLAKAKTASEKLAIIRGSAAAAELTGVHGLDKLDWSAVEATRGELAGATDPLATMRGQVGMTEQGREFLEGRQRQLELHHKQQASGRMGRIIGRGQQIVEEQTEGTGFLSEFAGKGAFELGRLAPAIAPWMMPFGQYLPRPSETERTAMGVAAADVATAVGGAPASGLGKFVAGERGVAGDKEQWEEQNGILSGIIDAVNSLRGGGGDPPRDLNDRQ
jgi:hypothetical protein